MASPTDGRPLPRRIAAALAIAGAISAVAVPAATAAPLTVRVVNTRGVEQASLVSPSLASCGGPCGLMGTDGNGRITLDVLPGDSLSVTRGDLAPEGAGVGYTVPDPVPADPVTITVPALPGTVSPGIDAAEAWLLEHVNAERAALGRAPLTLSSTLSRASDAYAHYLAANDLFSHTALAEPGRPRGRPGLAGAGRIVGRRGARAGAVEGVRAPGLAAERPALDPADDGRPRLRRGGPGRRALDHDARQLRHRDRHRALRPRLGPGRRARGVA